MNKPVFCISLVLCAYGITFASETFGKDDDMALVDAYAVIQEYRALRESCAVGTYEQRRQCLGKLSDASDSYRQAKEMVGSQSLSSMHKTLASQ